MDPKKVVIVDKSMRKRSLDDQIFRAAGINNNSVSGALDSSFNAATATATETDHYAETYLLKRQSSEISNTEKMNTSVETTILYILAEGKSLDFAQILQRVVMKCRAQTNKNEFFPTVRLAHNC